MTAETQKGPEPYGMATHLLLPHHTTRCAVRRPPPHATHNTLLLITLHQGENLRRLRQALRVLYGPKHTSRGHPLFKQVTVELTPQWWGTLTSDCPEVQADIQKGVLIGENTRQPLTIDPATVRALQEGKPSWGFLPNWQTLPTSQTLETPTLRLEVHHHASGNPLLSQLMLHGKSTHLTLGPLRYLLTDLFRTPKNPWAFLSSWKTPSSNTRENRLRYTHLALQTTKGDTLWLPLQGSNLQKLVLASQVLNGESNTVTSFETHLQVDLREIHFSLDGFLTRGTAPPISSPAQNADETERILHDHRHWSWQENLQLFVRDHIPPARKENVSVRATYRYAADQLQSHGVLHCPDVQHAWQTIQFHDLSGVLHRATGENGNFPLPKLDLQDLQESLT